MPTGETYDQCTHCSHKCRVDNMVRHYKAHLPEVAKTMVETRKISPIETRNPVVFHRRENGTYWCLCAVCEVGKRTATVSVAKTFEATHMKTCSDKFDSVRWMFDPTVEKPSHKRTAPPAPYKFKNTDAETKQPEPGQPQPQQKQGLTNEELQKRFPGLFDAEWLEDRDYATIADVPQEEMLDSLQNSYKSQQRALAKAERLMDTERMEAEIQRRVELALNAKVAVYKQEIAELTAENNTLRCANTTLMTKADMLDRECSSLDKEASKARSAFQTVQGKIANIETVLTEQGIEEQKAEAIAKYFLQFSP